MISKVFLLFALVAVISLVDCRPTHCERWGGDSGYRCAKDNYHSDYIAVRNRSGGSVSFKTGLWLSKCGFPGQNYADHTYHLGPGGSMDIPFGESGPGSCNEMFIYDCKINNRGANCLDAVNVFPN